MLMFAVVATLLPSLTTVWISYIENKRALQAKASEELLGVSAQALREVDLWTKELRYDLRVFSSSYEVTENLERIPLVNGEPVRSGIYFTRLTDYLNSLRDRPHQERLGARRPVLGLDRHACRNARVGPDRVGAARRPRRGRHAAAGRPGVTRQRARDRGYVE